MDFFHREQNWDETDTQIANFLFDQSSPVSYIDFKK